MLENFINAYQGYRMMFAIAAPCQDLLETVKKSLNRPWPIG